MQEWPQPRSHTTLKGFLGLTSFYRKFVKNYAALTAPLTDLLRLQNFTWPNEAHSAFTNLKNVMSTTPVLHLPDFSLPFDVEIDASAVVIGAVLSQGGHPLAFFSKKMTPRMHHSLAYVREMFTVTKSVKKSGVNFRLTLVKEFHESSVAGHSDWQPTLARLTASCSWLGVSKDIKKFVRECTICQTNKSLPQKPQGSLPPLQIPERVWEDLSMDFITHLPPSQGHTVIWVIMDRLTKYCHFIALPTRFSAETLACRFLNDVCKLHGVPKSIVSERDPMFLTGFWKELFKLLGTSLCYSTTYHPQSDVAYHLDLPSSVRIHPVCHVSLLRHFHGDPHAQTATLPLAEASPKPPVQNGVSAMDGPPIAASRSSEKKGKTKCSLLEENSWKRHHSLVEGGDPNHVEAEEKGWGENSVGDLLDGDNMKIKDFVLSSAKCIDKALKPCANLFPRAVN
ncbi:PREDICTED: uncharacterized protein LOC109363633 [Lupinus angustifolius]|uniref:uncharacterized protein LOC109363633 n=1 Tax=Lupinus angustifolius TaxID=3871 RepID=UPI00092F71F2|nr:PREDICTED: uncharacterized protein LOC109363633 [Lupinus angustifolius]